MVSTRLPPIQLVESTPVRAMTEAGLAYTLESKSKLLNQRFGTLDMRMIDFQEVRARIDPPNATREDYVALSWKFSAVDDRYRECGTLAQEVISLAENKKELIQTFQSKLTTVNDYLNDGYEFLTEVGNVIREKSFSSDSQPGSYTNANSSFSRPPSSGPDATTEPQPPPSSLTPPGSASRNVSQPQTSQAPPPDFSPLPGPSSQSQALVTESLIVTTASVPVTTDWLTSMKDLGPPPGSSSGRRSRSSGRSTTSSLNSLQRAKMKEKEAELRLQVRKAKAEAERRARDAEEEAEKIKAEAQRRARDAEDEARQRAADLEAELALDIARMNRQTYEDALREQDLGSDEEEVDSWGSMQFQSAADSSVPMHRPIPTESNPMVSSVVSTRPQVNFQLGSVAPTSVPGPRVAVPGTYTSPTLSTPSTWFAPPPQTIANLLPAPIPVQSQVSQFSPFSSSNYVPTARSNLDPNASSFHSRPGAYPASVNVQSQQPREPEPQSSNQEWMNAFMYRPTEGMRFSGKPEEFLSFINFFENSIGRYVRDPLLKLKELIGACSNEIQDKLRHCQSLSPEEGYSKAVSILWEDYGAPECVLDALLSNLKGTQTIAQNNLPLLRQHSRDVSAALSLLTALNERSQGMYDYIAQACNKDLIANIISRTPYWISDYSREYPGLKGLHFPNIVAFLTKKTSVTRDPLAQAATELLRQRNASNRGKNREIGRTSPVMNAKSKSNPTLFLTDGESEKSSDNKPDCLFHPKANHKLFKCREFLALDEKDRFEQVFKFYRCWNCGGPHFSKECPEDRHALNPTVRFA